MIELRNGEAQLGLLPALGGSVAFWRLHGRDILAPTIDPSLAAQRGAAIAAYPLVPYSNRIGNARFSFDGETYCLNPNIGGENNAIHGNGWEREWSVAQHDSERAIFTLDHDPGKGDDPAQWPFAYRAVISYILERDRLRVEILLANRDTRPQPVGLGFHPFFARTEEMTLRFSARGVWENDASHLPKGLTPCTDDWDFSAGRPVRALSVDNCFAGWTDEAVLAAPDAGYRVRISADPVFSHLVVFTAPEKPFVAVEAVTNMNDAINHPEILERGLHLLAPGERLSGVVCYDVIEPRGQTR